MITLLTSDDPLPLRSGGAQPPAAGPAGLLFECAADSAYLAGLAEVVPATDLIGPPAEAKRAAAALASTLLAGEPAILGVRQLGVFEEVVVRELAWIFHLLELDRRIQGGRFGGCRFAIPTRRLEGLPRIQRGSGSSYRIERVRRRRRFGQDFAALGGSRSRPDGLRDLARRAARRFLPCSARLLPELGIATRDPAPGGWWFYTTAYTFTRAGLAYEPHLPEPLRYLVEDRSTGGRALAELGRSGHSLYAFAGPRDLPRPGEAAGAAGRIRAHLAGVPLDGREAVAREEFLEGGWFRAFRARLLPLGLFHSRILRRWLERVRPDVVLAGNAVFEGYLLQQARARRIPTAVLQHGILGDYYQLIDLPADHLVVRGPLFRDFLCEPARAKAVVLGRPEDACRPGRGHGRRGGDVLFLTAPYAMQPLFHPAELDEILLVLARAAARAGRRLVVRVHPLERPEAYASRLERLLEEGLRPETEVTAGGDLGPALRRSAVAILFSSTAFLDCLREGVPVVSFGWHDFALKPLVEERRLFHFARSLADLERLVDQALAGRLEPRPGVFPEVATAFDEPRTKAFFAGLAPPAA